ncbi:unnamed protein product [Victoria cruziana]
MQPSSEGMTSMGGSLSSQHMLIREMQPQEIANPHQTGNLDHHQISHDDFLEQMISTLPSWSDLSSSSFPQNLPNGGTNKNGSDASQKLFTMSLMSKPENASQDAARCIPSFDDSAMLASRLRQHHISSGGSSPGGGLLGLLQPNTPNLGFDPSQLLHPSSAASCVGETGGNAGGCGGGGLPMPLRLGQGNDPDSSSDSHLRDAVVDASFKNCVDGAASVQGLYNGFQTTRSPANNNQHFQNAGMNQAPASVQAPGTAAPARPRVRARRGQATDPHSIAERLRRERIAERMKALQELVPNANKTDKASMLDEIIDYVKFLQLQVKVLSMSRLGGAAAVAPLVTNISPEASGIGRRNTGDQTAATASSQDSLTATEQQVVKLMEEDMGSAMQYLQGRGLCLMPISLASAISSTTCHSRGANTNNTTTVRPSTIIDPSPPSPSISVLTVQSALGSGGGCAADALKDATPVSKT